MVSAIATVKAEILIISSPGARYSYPVSSHVDNARIKAIVVPIFKKGSRSDPANYRPISLTSLLCKTLEHIINSHVMGHLELNNILSTNQFGFHQKHPGFLIDSYC